MSARTTIALVGVILTGMGLASLFDPSLVIWWVGYAIADPSAAASVFGEVRAVYGGLFTVIGVFTMLSAIDPAANRSRLIALGCCWLGLAGGRLVGVWLDGNPGLLGWLFLVLEAAAGAAVVGLALTAGGEQVRPPAVVQAAAS